MTERRRPRQSGWSSCPVDTIISFPINVDNLYCARLAIIRRRFFRRNLRFLRRLLCSIRSVSRALSLCCLRVSLPLQETDVSQHSTQRHRPNIIQFSHKSLYLLSLFRSLPSTFFLFLPPSLPPGPPSFSPPSSRVTFCKLKRQRFLRRYAFLMRYSVERRMIKCGTRGNIIYQSECLRSERRRIT